MLKVYDIATPAVAQTLSLLTNKPVRWFPKLTVSVGGRTWSYDGEVERTVDAIVENAAGGPALRTLNAGPCLLATDAEVDALLDSMGATDYTPEEYDFFYRNCNHFCLDLTERLAGVERLASLRLAPCTTTSRAQWRMALWSTPSLPLPTLSEVRACLGACQ